MAEGSLTLAGDFDIVAPRTAPQDALYGTIEGRAWVYHAASMLIWAAFGIPAPGGKGRGLRFHHLQAARFVFIPPLARGRGGKQRTRLPIGLACSFFRP